MFKKVKNWLGSRGQSIPAEMLVMSNTDRYIDPLIEEKTHNIHVAAHREDVAAQDSIANILTWGFHFRAWSKYPKFYESDELGAPEIGLEVRDFLKQMNFHQPAIVAGALCGVHGWSNTKFSTDDKGDLDYEIFSEKQCPYQNVIRDINTKRVIAWNTYDRPRLPLNRTVMNYISTSHFIIRDDPGVILLCRGDEKASYGYGYSILEPTWDSIVKLREESHANALRARVFPISVVPANWKKEQIKSYFKKISRMDQTTALVSKSGKDPNGELVPELPNFQWISPGASASGKSSQGGAGVFSDLSSEWVRLCGVTHHTIRYFTGNPGGALAAASEDSDDDDNADIEEFNMYREYIRMFIDWLREEGIPIDLPDSFVVKCHWEWERDEMLVQQQLMAEREIAMQDENAERIDREPEAEIKENKKINALATALIASLSRTKQRTEESKKREIAKGADTQQLLQLDPEEGKKGDIQSDKWLPVNSASGNTEGIYLDSGDENTVPTIFISFRGGQIYSYQEDENWKGTPEEIVQKIMADGGDQVWEQLRADRATRSGKKPGEHPTGSAKTGGGKFAYAGRAHMMQYKKERAGPVAQGLTKQIKQTDQQSKSIGEQSKKMKERTKAIKGVSGKVSKGLKGLMGLYSKAWNNELPPTVHPIIQKHNSITNAAKMMHKGKNSLYKIMDVIIDAHRFNSMSFGNSFSTSNPFIYDSKEAPSGYSVEYQCPDSIKELIGSSVPIWLGHKDKKRTEDEYVGTYNITGWDDEKGIEVANYDIDWDLVDYIFERERVENWIKPLRDEGLYPDTSTEYFCKLKYNRELSKFIQTDFKLIGLALVKQGNCAGTACKIADT